MRRAKTRSARCGAHTVCPRASRLRACGIASETRSFRAGRAGNALWSISSTTRLVDDDFQDIFGRSRVITVRHYVNEASPDKCVIGPVAVVEAAPAARFNDGDIICRDGGDRQMCGIGARDVGGAVLGALGSPGADSRQVTPCTGLGDENRQNRSTRACEVREIQLGRRISGGVTGRAIRVPNRRVR